MTITGTHIAYLHTCKRKLWLFARYIRMEHDSETVHQGKLIGEHSYARRSEKYTELEVAGSKIDFYDVGNKVVHEVKKSNKVERAHIAQVLFYLWLLEQEGIDGVTARIEYPKLKETRELEMTAESRQNVTSWVSEARNVIQAENCPPVINKPICRSCSYFEFCYAGEPEMDSEESAS